MDEAFENRQLVAPETLVELKQRSDSSSLVRLIVQILALTASAALVIANAHTPSLAVTAAILFAAVWASFFAPLHECTHGTAFRSRRLNAAGAWVAGLVLGFAPSVYRALHFAHHRHTHDPEKDPELATAPALFSIWPTNIVSWLLMISGWSYIVLKLGAAVGFSLLPYSAWERIAPWAPPIKQRPRLAWEARAVTLFWGVLALAALTVPGLKWILLAVLIGHVFQAVWLSTEHRGRPHAGPVLARTRSIRTPSFVRWWIWNMNYHAEHHGWPTIPWHNLPALHWHIAKHLDDFGQGYIQTHITVLRHIGKRPAA